MSKGDLIDSHVSLKQCKKAVDALHSHELKKKEKFEEGQLLPAKEQNVWLNVTVKAIPSGHKLKPVKIPIVHPLVDPRTSPVCLITKDPQREYKDLLEKHNIKFISRVVGIEKLKGKFKPFEARRMLLKENGMFLADERIIPLLPKLLGSKWFEAKKQPIPVCLTRKDLKGELERAISSTYMNQNQGTCTSIKIGKMSQKPSQILDNLKTALPSVVNAIKGGWDNVQSLNIKTNSSVSLPIWSCTLDDAEGGRWNGFQVKSDSEDESMEGDASEEEEEEGEVKVAKTKKDATGKGRKRASASDEDEEEEKPKKKVKAADGASSTKAKPTPTSKSTKIVSAEVDGTSKKRKASDPTTPAPTASPSVVPISSGKKAPKAKAASATTSSDPTIASPAPKGEKIPESDTKKVKKSQAAHTPALASQSSSPATSDLPSKKKKSNKADVSTTKSDTSPSPSAPDTATPSAGKDKSDKDKKKASKAAPVSAILPTSDMPVKPSLTRDEMKQKRGATSREKKEIVAKSKGGKSAKNAVLGRKVAQE
ncbi:hypothetical protein CVT25_011263 [Psilocybe cyanescens]|uniref:Ribosomal L1 domain-containing protein 1 n=1 Tax=Psilocybe cyanescens TaxID=93625 RepID=A0A409XCE2_PSICY|nr:hypothetical protein CVT25_011263 [Psilocybe cyanescens]